MTKFLYACSHVINMSDVDIAYDVRLENLLEKVKFQIWLNEELQIQGQPQREMILKSLSNAQIDEFNPE